MISPGIMTKKKINFACSEGVLVRGDNFFKMMEEKNDTVKDDCFKTPNGSIDSTIETQDNENQMSNIETLHENNDMSIFKVPSLPFQPKPVKQHGSDESEVQTSKENKTTVLDKLSPAEKLKNSQTPIPYKEPSWGGLCNEKYSFEVLKNGVIIDNIDLYKSFYVLGRLPSCDMTLEHPSLSRHHAVIQYCATKTEKHDIGWYLYDLDSTHGTWINKHKVYSKKYYRLHVGHVLKFGGSTRLFILQGPDEDQEDESEMSASEMKEQREKQKKEAEVLRQAEIVAQEQKIDAINRKKEENSGCSWGMSDDAIDEEDASPFSQEIKLESEELYINDPKKALKGFYEREGYEEPEYIVTDAGSGKYKCAVELPVDDPSGKPVIAEAIVSGKKKEAVLQCALEGCRILDRMNLLRASTHESRKRKQKNWEDDDFYDSDEDAYLDRTGDIEKKRQQRMKKAGKTEGTTETYKSLLEKHEVILKDIQDIEAKLEKAKSDAAAMETDDLDALDAYMMAIKSGVMDTKTKMALKRQLMELKQDEMKIRKLVNIAKPASLPELKSPQVVPKSNTQQIPNKLPIVGKIKSQKPQKRPVVTSKSVKEIKEKEDDFIEEEDDDEDEPSNKHSREDPTSRLQGEQEEDDSTSKLKGTQVATKSSKSQELHKSSQQSTNVSLSKLKETNSEDGSGKPSTEKNKQKKKGVKQISSEGRITGSYNSTDPDYAVWMPPTGQTGDGKTSLNEKYGY